MLIEYTEDKVCGEPGPNFYLAGTPQDFLVLANTWYPLAVSDDVMISLPVTVNGKESTVFASSKKHQKILNQYIKEENRIIMELDKKYWKIILKDMFNIAVEKGRIYVDMEGESLIEDANFIIDSQL